MKLPLLLVLQVTMLCGCDRLSISAPVEPSHTSLAEARQGFETHLVRKQRDGEPAPEPPADRFRLVHYNSPAGALAAYVSPSPGDHQKHPLIIWIVGGFSNGIGEIAWTPGPEDNDQSAVAFQKAGILMMYPSLRGGNDNPGFMEGFYGEVDDVLAAAEYASKLDYVDPERIYLGGHSTGGTLALLAGECSDKFRALFSFGPIDDVSGYGQRNLPFNPANAKEVSLRSPEKWLTGIHTPTFMFEGTEGRSNISSLRALARAKHPSIVSFHPVPGADHFSTLAPVSRLIAQKIKADTGPKVNIEFQEKELAAAMKR